MFNLDFICQHPDRMREALRKRHDKRNINDILQLAEQRRSLAAHNDKLFVELKKVKDSLRAKATDQRTFINEQIKILSEEIHQLELQMTDIDTRLQLLILHLPNIPHSSVKENNGNSSNEEIRRWGEVVPFFFEPQAHWEIGARLGIFESESAARVSGSRFVTLKGFGARLERALISFMLDVHTRKHGYTEIMPPQLVKRAVMIGAGQLPKFEAQAYACTEDELYLNPTAEVPLIGMHYDTTLPGEQLPVRLVAWTTAYRREAGSSARQNRGLLRLHQFNKVELFQIVAPQESYRVFEQMVNHAEEILQQLELPYRVVALTADQLPFTAAKTYDLEVWMPGSKSFVEVSSISNCELFQAQRANIKYRPIGVNRATYVHTLNASGLAVGRTMAALLEVYQQADGSVVIPKVLRPYIGTGLLTVK